MNLQQRNLLVTLLAAVLILLAGQPATAGVVSVDTSEARIAVSATGPSTVTVFWTVVRRGATAATVSSPSGRLLVNGSLVTTVSRTLSRQTTGSGADQSLTYTETLTVPRSAVFRSVKAGAPIVYQRTFIDSNPPAGGGPGSLSGSVNLSPTGPGSEPFSVSRLSLKFDDQSRVKVLPKGGHLRAIAELNTTGAGLITGQWEIATAATTPGTPVFRPLALVRQGVAGGRRTVIISPPLPTRFEGANLVRLRLTDPAPFFDEPELQYYVTPESALPDQQVAQPILVTAPGPDMPLTQTTRFAWQAVSGAKIYKLEIFEAEPGPAGILAGSETTGEVPLDPVPDTSSIQGLRPLTGVVLPGAVTEVRLQDFTLAHLPPDRRYQWTVKALDESGAVVGVSPPRVIYKP